MTLSTRSAAALMLSPFIMLCKSPSRMSCAIAFVMMPMRWENIAPLYGVSTSARTAS